MLSANHEMTSVCFGIVVQCQKLNIIGYFFSLSYMPMHDMLKKKNMQRKSKAKRIKMLLNMVASMFLGDVGIIGCTSKVIVPIKQLWLCVSVCDFLISQIVITCRHLCSLVMFFTQHAIFFTTLDTCAGTMWFDHHKVLHVLMYAH